MKLLNWLLSLIKGNNPEAKQLTSGNLQNPVVEKKDRNPEIISASQDYIKKIHELCKLAKGTIYYDKIILVFEKTQIIHDRIVNDEKIPNTRLEQFHMYYSDGFLDTFGEALDDLRPKKPIDLKLKSNFKLQEELEIERINTERENIIANVSSLTDNERINILITNHDNSLKIIKVKEFDDVCETKNGVRITFADKYTTYLFSIFNNLQKCAPNGKFIGDLNDKSETPIVYDKVSKDVFKIVFKPKNEIVLIGNVSDENITKILLKSLPQISNKTNVPQF